MKKIILLVIFVSSLIIADAHFFERVEDGQYKNYLSDRSKIKALDKVSSISIETPEGEIVTFYTQKYTRHANKIVSWRGESAGSENFLKLTINARGILMGKMLLGEQAYEIRPHVSKLNQYTILKINTQNLSSTCQAHTPKLKSSTPVLSTSEVPNVAYATESTQLDTLTLLILYTQEFADHYGENTELTLQYYIDTANDIFTNSKTFTQVVLAHSELTDNTLFAEPHTISIALNNFLEDEEVARLKRKYNTDLVMLARRYSNTGGCGLGYVYSTPTRTNTPYTLIEIKASSEGGFYCPDTTLAHEFGHNLGCAHDRSHATIAGMFDYSYGYDVPNEFATVMSYDTPGIPYFSNPSLQYNGTNIGLAEGDAEAADCAKTIRQTKSYISNPQALELGDGFDSGAMLISGTIQTPADQDRYTFTLSGDITFTLTGIPYFINIYNSEGNKVETITESTTKTFANATYTFVVTLYSSSTSFYNLSNINYTIGLSSSNGTISQVDLDTLHTSFIERFYQNILNRPSDAGGLAYWVNRLKTESATSVAEGFFNSNEFNVVSDSEFVDILYNTLFDRAADTAGKNTWLSKLSQGESRESVRFGFYQSIEFKNLADSFQVTAIRSEDLPSSTGTTGIDGYVNRFYTLVLNRAADAQGFAYWTASLRDQTKRGGDIAKGFFNSTEYTQRALDNATFIDICYRAFFGREADTGGKSYWLNQISQGKTKEYILDGFINSIEFKNLTQSYGILP